MSGKKRSKNKFKQGVAAVADTVTAQPRLGSSAPPGAVPPRRPSQRDQRGADLAAGKPSAAPFTAGAGGSGELADQAKKRSRKVAEQRASTGGGVSASTPAAANGAHLAAAPVRGRDTSSAAAASAPAAERGAGRARAQSGKAKHPAGHVGRVNGGPYPTQQRQEEQRLLPRKKKRRRKGNVEQQGTGGSPHEHLAADSRTSKTTPVSPTVPTIVKVPNKGKASAALSPFPSVTSSMGSPVPMHAFASVECNRKMGSNSVAEHSKIYLKNKEACASAPFYVQEHQ